ncbi:MAG: leucine-rich repeat domain-containing protein [Prevotellaceae bacterium]|nr:leucine-rich repeat domain-containing protein [Prevotellaceae bacterium]
MKKIVLVFSVLSIAFSALNAQVSKTLSVTAGGLYRALTNEERQTITDIVLTGTIDARDFKTMRDAMPNLAVVDMSRVNIVAFSGTKGTIKDGNTKSANYKANEIPQYAFFNPSNLTGSKSLAQIIFPKSLAGIGERAFWKCRQLTEAVIPATVTTIGEEAYYDCQNLKSITVFTTKPITKLGKGIFTAVDPSSCILHVPEGSLEAYQGAKQWGEFINIQDDVVLKSSDAE